MKKLLLFLLIGILPSLNYSQESEGNPWAWDAEGNVVGKNGSNESINDILNRYFSNYKLTGTDISFESEDGNEYIIVYQKFSYEPLFLADFGGKRALTAQQIKKAPQILAEFKDKHRYRDVNIDDNYMIENDIKDAIEKKLTDLWFIEALGKPDNSYKNSNGYKSYKYNGSEKSIVLIFENGIIRDYRIHGGF